MGANESRPVKKGWKHAKAEGLDMDLVEEVMDNLDAKEDGIGDAANEALRGILAGLKDDDGDDPDFAVLKIVRDDKVKVEEYSNKAKAKKAFKKAKKKGCSAVMVKGGTIYDGQCTGDRQKVTFIIGMAFGKGWCDLGPLNDEGSDYCIFEPGDDDEDDEDDDDDDDDDDAWHMLIGTRDGTGVVDKEYPKKKQAKKKFKKKCKKGMQAILIKGGRIKGFSGDGDEGGDLGGEDAVMRLTFLIGVAYGRGSIEDLGPLEDDGPLAILEDDFDADSSDDE